MNIRLVDRLGAESNVIVLDAQRWVAVAGRNAFSPKLWYQAKIPFGNALFQEAVKDVKAALRGLEGRAKKLIIVDLDDTLWGGLVGDIGWEHLRLGGHDALGEAFADFQQALKSLTRRGIVLGIVSKNEESIALTAIDQHPEMQLRREDFVGWRINWQDKAVNLVELVSELNLVLQSVVFIDDNPVERARVREALPEVYVPEWPENPMLYRTALLSLRCFDAPAISREDAGRTQAYVSERQRTELKLQVSSLDEWLKGLNMQVWIQELNKASLSRAAQLLNKTNQLTLTTRRLSEVELEEWSRQPGHHVWTFRVSDRFGDSGLVGLASLEVKGRSATVVDFLLSCRVMGRKVEETMTQWLVSRARELGADRVIAKYVPTSKNKPCLEFWHRSGFTCESLHSFTWTGLVAYPLPDGIRVFSGNAAQPEVAT